MAKQINCGICAFYGNTVAMNLVNGHFECPECNAELHDNLNGDDSFIHHYKQQQQNNNYISRSFQPGTHVIGGNDPTGKPKKEAMKKKTLSRLKFNIDSPRFT